MLNRKGFTLIELLIVVVIIGILAAIAIPKFASTKEKAYLASMKSDLRNLATAEEGYFADNQVYRSGTASNLAGTATPDAAHGRLHPVGWRDDHLHGDRWHGLERHHHAQRDRQDLRHLHRRGGSGPGDCRRRAEVRSVILG